MDRGLEFIPTKRACFKGSMIEIVLHTSNIFDILNALKCDLFLLLLISTKNVIGG